MKLARPRLTAAASAFWEGPALRRAVAPFFRDLHAVMGGSLALLADAERKARRRDDTASAALASYLAAHRAEELPHVGWLEADMMAAGIGRGRRPSRAVAALLREERRLLRVHPVAVLGYLRVVEGLPPRQEELRRIARRAGLPSRAFRTLRHHARVDPAHAAEIDVLLDRLSLSPEQQSCACLAAMMAMGCLADLLDELHAEAA